MIDGLPPNVSVDEMDPDTLMCLFVFLVADWLGLEGCPSDKADKATADWIRGVMRAAETRLKNVATDPLGYDSTDGLPAVGGEVMGKTINDHVRRCRILLGEEQEKPSPDNTLIDTLCDSVRLAREFSRVGKPEKRCPCGDMTVNDCAGECGRPGSNAKA